VQWGMAARVVTARFARYAGAWAAYALERDRFALLVIGAGLSPHGLQLRQLRSGAAYHFNPRSPDPASSGVSLTGASLGFPRPPRPKATHPP
jgi:hypothetical protein